MTVTPDSVSKRWHEYWKPYFDGIMAHTGLTLEQVMLFELVLSYNSLVSGTAKHMDNVRPLVNRLRQELGDDDDQGWKPK